jgi:glycosyltransferase involved in cell wall biosynthesis
MSDRPPHILMLLDQDFPPDLRVENEARTLAAAGYDVTVLSIAPDTRPVEDSLGPVRIVRARIPGQLRNKMRGLAGTLPLLHVFVHAQVKRIHRNHPVDVLHAHDLYLFGPALWSGRRLGMKVVGDMHENWVDALRSYAWSTRAPGKWVVRPDRWQVLEDRWSRAVDHLIVVIEEMAERLEDRGISADHMTVVPNTIRLDTFESWPTEPVPEIAGAGPVILYTGGMDRHRGLEELVDAMPTVLAAIPDAQLVLVGDGATRQELVDRCAVLGLEKAVLFTGWQPQERVKSFMAVASVGLIPHRRSIHTDHTIPHKLFHYMHMRLPVIASDCRPLVRILEDSEAGLTYTSGQSAELADRIVSLLQDPDRRHRMGEHGHAAVHERWNWDATATGLVAAYSRLAPRTRDRGSFDG